MPAIAAFEYLVQHLSRAKRPVGRARSRRGRGQPGRLLHLRGGGFLRSLGSNGEWLFSPQEEKRAAGYHRAGYHRDDRDRKSTRLNSSHITISYAVFCLKKKKKKYNITHLKKKKKQKIQ